MPAAAAEQRLRVLLADDQRQEVADAERVLRDLDYDVDIATRYSEAEAKLRDGPGYDIVVIDLGWYTDPEFAGDAHGGRADTAGWALNALAAEGGALRVLYSQRLDDPLIRATAVKGGMLPVRKAFSEQSRQYLADLLAVIAEYRRESLLAIARGEAAEDERRRLAADLDRVGRDHERLAAQVDKLRSLRTVVLAAGAMLVLVFVAVAATAAVTDSTAVVALAAGVALFLVLVILVASARLTRSDLEALLPFLDVVPTVGGNRGSRAPDA